VFVPYCIHDISWLIHHISCLILYTYIYISWLKYLCKDLPDVAVGPVRGGLPSREGRRVQPEPEREKEREREREERGEREIERGEREREERERESLSICMRASPHMCLLGVCVRARVGRRIQGESERRERGRDRARAIIYS
jgi:hypothetical protein